MPPLQPRPRPTGDTAQYPNQVLTLGGNRWLTHLGTVVTERPRGTFECDLTSQTLHFWERAARKGGTELADLIE